VADSPEPDNDAELAELAEQPEMVWDALVKNAPYDAIMEGIETMLKAGRSPEWILNRKSFFQMPVGVQTVFLNALHWRQTQLRGAYDQVDR